MWLIWNCIYVMMSVERILKFLMLNPLNVNPTKWSNTLKQFVGFCWRIDHVVGLALEGLTYGKESIYKKLLEVNIKFCISSRQRRLWKNYCGKFLETNRKTPLIETFSRKVSGLCTTLLKNFTTAGFFLWTLSYFSQ